MRLRVHEVLEKVSKAKKKEDKVKILRENETGALRDVLRGTYDERIVWNLPGGSPPYEPNKEGSIPSDLIRETRKLAYIAKGGKGDKLIPVKRETIFIGMLEAIHPKDAEVLVKMINKKAITGVPKSVVKEAFPQLLPDK